MAHLVREVWGNRVHSLPHRVAGVVPVVVEPISHPFDGGNTKLYDSTTLISTSNGFLSHGIALNFEYRLSQVYLGLPRGGAEVSRNGPEASEPCRGWVWRVGGICL